MISIGDQCKTVTKNKVPIDGLLTIFVKKNGGGVSIIRCHMSGT